MDHALGNDSRSTARWSWTRSTSIAAALAVHIAAIALLAMPQQTPLPAMSAVEPVTMIQLIERAPEPVAAPVPEEPQPPPRARTAKIPVRITASAPAEVAAVVTGEASPAEAVSRIDAPATPREEPRAAAPATHATLGYEAIVSPNYPRDAKRRGEHGTVWLSVLVDRNGRPEKVEVARSSGSPRLDRAALEAVQKWRFRPVQINGVTVPARGTVPIAFTLENA